MSQRSQAVVACGYGHSLMRWWLANSTKRYITSLPHRQAAQSAAAHRHFSSSVSQRPQQQHQLPAVLHSDKPAFRTTSQLKQAADGTIVPHTPQSLEEADRRESAEDEAASSTPAAIQRQLAGLNAIADSLQAEIAQQNIALQQHGATAAAATVKRVQHRAATLRDSYASLIDTAYRAHKRNFALKPHTEPLSHMSPQLAAMERVWVDMCRYSQPSVEAFTSVISAYGREARRTRIRDLIDRWVEDKDKFEQSLPGAVKPDRRADGLSAAVDEESVEVVEARERKRVRAVNARRKREAALGLPAHVSLYPAVRADTHAFNASLSAYLSSLTLERLTSESTELSYPLSLLPRFRHDGITISILMNAHTRMGETARVLQLFETHKRTLTEARRARGGARETQEVRHQLKQQMQYIYAAVVNALARAKDVESAEAVWTDIKTREQRGQLVVNRVMYHSMLAVYAATNQQEKLRAISVEMKRAGQQMDADSVCTVLTQLCNNGHISDALMLHNRIPHGSMGVATQHRKTYTTLLTHLSHHPSVPFLTTAEVYRQGMECGLLRSRYAHMQKWVMDLRTVRLQLLPVAIHYHMMEMLDAYMAVVRQQGLEAARRMVPRRGLLVLVGKSSREREQLQREEELDTLADLQAIDAPAGRENGHRLSVAAIDWDEEDDSGSDRVGSHHTPSVLIDPFATEEESTLLSQLDTLKVQGSYVQRWVQHLFKQEWPTLDAVLPTASDDATSSGDSTEAFADPSSPSLSAGSVERSTSAMLYVFRSQLLFWLACHAHVKSGDAATFPMPHVHGQSTKWLSTIQRRISDRQQQLQASQQQWERATAKKGGVVAGGEESSGSEGAMSLLDELVAYKRREREELLVKARIFNTKRVPAAFIAGRRASQQRAPLREEPVSPASRRQRASPQQQVQAHSRAASREAVGGAMRADRRSSGGRLRAAAAST